MEDHTLFLPLATALSTTIWPQLLLTSQAVPPKRAAHHSFRFLKLQFNHISPKYTTPAIRQKGKWEGQQLEPQENILVLKFILFHLRHSDPSPCYSRLDFSAQPASVMLAPSVHSQKCCCGLSNTEPSHTNPNSGCRDKSVQRRIYKEKDFTKTKTQIATIFLQECVISMFGNISNSPNTSPNSQKLRQTGRCCCYRGSGSPQNAGYTQTQLLRPMAIKVRKSGIANPSTNIQIKNYNKGKVDGEWEIIEETQRTPLTAKRNLTIFSTVDSVSRPSNIF